MNDRSQYLKIMKEWHCCSRYHAFIHLYFGATGAYICLMYLLNIILKDQQLNILFEDQILNTLIALLAAISTFFFWKLFKTKRKKIKQVYFTPKAIYIENKKIDISYLKSITFIKLKYPTYNRGSTFKFCIRFTENRVIKEDIYFYMEFGKPFRWKYQDYNFEDCFITILEDLAKERRELLKDSCKAI